MLRSSSFFGVLFTAASAAVLACGGSVVFTEDGGEGGSGVSGPTTSTTTKTTTKATTTTMSTTAPSSSTGMPLTPCEVFCNSPAAPCFGDGDSCLQFCADVYPPGCEPETDALLLCYAQYLSPECVIESQCVQAEEAFYACTSKPADCQDFNCTSEDNWCSCYGQCFGTNYEQFCEATPTQIQCSCNGDFGSFGTCTQEVLSCSLDAGCCKQFFFDG